LIRLGRPLPIGGRAGPAAPALSQLRRGKTEKAAVRQKSTAVCSRWQFSGHSTWSRSGEHCPAGPEVAPGLAHRPIAPSCCS